ncbi:class I SAM-dependent methyltransferase [Jatrophihabitans endophyticus]|uniref:class I SAM-dependent methyltransferase n=1 Tax=Jatrophihabitans endophyticus TaxID=1206085 RepID=UPI0019F73B6B|nr:class I SAM-dependent methyltransferase [Jatrophihabitans endophyticus]MBE7190113.1 class I SAM-dependent methyltransferase [Jatrophihabitans endophyticus]
MPDFDADYWDSRYSAADTVWGSAPNRWVAQELADLAPGRALDLACGEGRNALWLSARGWTVLAVDWSIVALDRGRAAEPAAGHVEWIKADATVFEPAVPVDLALVCYLQVPPADRRAAVTHAARSLAPGGVLLVVAHDSRNLEHGTGGPRDPDVLYTASDVASDLEGTGLVIERADEVSRPVDGAERAALDCLLRARRAKTA